MDRLIPEAIAMVGKAVNCRGYVKSLGSSHQTTGLHNRVRQLYAKSRYVERCIAYCYLLVKASPSSSIYTPVLHPKTKRPMM
jgi:hypothetical protein